MANEAGWANSTLRIASDPATGRRWGLMGFGPGAVAFDPQTGERFTGNPDTLQWSGETGQFQTFAPEPSTTAKIAHVAVPAGIALLAGGALGSAAGLGGAAGAGEGGLASLGPVATEGFAGATPALGAGAGTFSAPASLAGIASGATSAAGGGMFDFLTNVFSGAQDLFSQAGTGIQNFFSNVFGGNPFGEVGGIPNAGSFGISEGGAFPGWIPDSTGLLLPASEAAGGGGIGSFLQNIFGNFGNNARSNPLSTLANIASVIQGFSSAGDARDAGRDPLGLSRASAAARLTELTNNPSLITSYPGYQAGLEGVLRGSAAAGYTASGNELAALQKYGGQFYNDEVTRLAQLAGFQFSPVQLTAGQQEAEAQATNLIARALGNLGFMFRSPFPATARAG